MTNEDSHECELLLFHSTTKENLKGIMKEGLKPGMKGGWCDLTIKALGEKMSPEVKLSIDRYRKDCQKNVYLSPSFEHLRMPKGSETIITVCIPKKIAYIKDRPFKWKDALEANEVTVKETIPLQNIMGCLDIKEKFLPVVAWISPTKFRINKDCK